MTSDQSSSDIRSRSVSRAMPALATRTSTGPWCSSTAVKAASTEAVSVISQGTAKAPSGAAPDRLVTATLSPWARKASAMARPIPRLPPVTRTDLLTRATLEITSRYAESPGRRTGSVVFQPEADLDADLEVLDGAVLDLAAHLGHLEPVHVAQRLRGAFDAVADGLVDAFGGCADDLGHAVGAIRHGARMPRPRRRPTPA